MPLDPDERRSLARAFWAYSGDGQKAFAAKTGIKYDRLRAALNDDAKSPPSTDELLLMADAAGLPAEIALNGLAGDAALLDRIGDLEAQVKELAAGLAAVSADSARHTRELAELRDKDRRTERPGEGG